MKFQPNPKYNTIAAYVLGVALIMMILYQMVGHIGVVFGFVGSLIGYVTPIVYGFVFAFLLNPLRRTYEDRLLPLVLRKFDLKRRTMRTIALILTYITALIFLSAFIALVVPQIISSVGSIWNNMPSYLSYFNGLYNQINEFLSDLSAGESDSGFYQITDELVKKVIEAMGSLLEMTYEIISKAMGTLVTAATSFTTGIVNLLLGIIVSIYMLFEQEKVLAQIKKITIAILPKSVYPLVFDITQDINRIFSGFVMGKVIDSIIIGILCAIGLSILNMPYAVLISVIVGVTNVIPYFGPFIGAIPGFFIILIVDPIKSIWFLVFILLLQQLDGNVIGPKILGDTVGLSPLWIIFSITLFSGLLGILGTFIGVPLFAIIYSLIRRFVSHLLTRKGESTKTQDYASPDSPLLDEKTTI